MIAIIHRKRICNSNEVAKVITFPPIPPNGGKGESCPPGQIFEKTLPSDTSNSSSHRDEYLHTIFDAPRGETPLGDVEGHSPPGGFPTE